MRPFLVAIDGPAGAGKSTASRMTAKELGFSMVDTGAIYRTVALAASRAGLAFTDDAGLASILPGLEIALVPRESGGQTVRLAGEDVSAAIRTPEMSLGASAVSARPVVRDALLDLQRRLALAAPTGAVLEGRDIGTVVFPDADAKFFLTASPEARAGRRHAEMAARGEIVPFEAVLKDQLERDRNDAERPIAPLKPAADAEVFDTTGLRLDQVVAHLVARVRSRLDAGGRAG